MSSFITDVNFRKAVVTEVGKWYFADVVSEPLIVACPLLFVHEGMDITTLVQWEKALVISLITEPWFEPRPD